MSAAPQTSLPEHRSPIRNGWGRGKSAVLSTPVPAIETPKVSLRDITLCYKGNGNKPLLALDRISLDVKAGEFLCIAGPSVCGKSTLLNLIAALSQPTAGEVLIDDRVVDSPGTDRIMLFQELGLFPWLT